LLAGCAPALLSLAGCGPVDDAAGESVENAGNALQAAKVYEAESALLSGPIVGAAFAGFTGTGYVDYQAATGEFVEWTVQAAAAGSHQLAIRYASGAAASRPLQIVVNGVVVSSALAFPPTGGWDKWATASVTTNLKSGANKVRATSTGSSGANLDQLAVTELAPPPFQVTLQAEAALLSGAIVSNAHGGYTGTGFVDYQAASGDFIEWTVNAPAAGIATLGFRHANGSANSRPLSVRVNGTVVNASLAFPATGGWDKFATVTMAATLNAGVNKVRTTAIGSSGSDFDYLQVTQAANAVLAVKPSVGCGQVPPQSPGGFVKYTIATSGTKAANATGVPGPWSYNRDYYLWLPPGYDANKAYPLVFQMPGCGGNGTNVYPLYNDAGAAGVGGTVIRVGLTPPPNAINHATNPNQGCFDDKEGDDSVDFVFYEKLRDTLKTQLCYDENRVFASGNSSGSWIANEMACKYSGNTQGYAIRGIAANTGGLPTDPRFVPACTGSPMAGIWIHEVNDPENLFAGAKVAINRAMAVNGCTIGTGYDTTMFDNYAIGGGNADTTCKLIKGCPAIYPLVVCALPGNAHGSHDNIANPGFSKFIAGFSFPPFTN
jgi:hypothetical protein